MTSDLSEETPRLADRFYSSSTHSHVVNISETDQLMSLKPCSDPEEPEMVQEHLEEHVDARRREEQQLGDEVMNE